MADEQRGLQAYERLVHGGDQAGATRGACKKCGGMGHLTYECKNNLQLASKQHKGHDRFAQKKAKLRAEIEQLRKETERSRKRRIRNERRSPSTSSASDSQSHTGSSGSDSESSGESRRRRRSQSRGRRRSYSSDSAESQRSASPEQPTSNKK